MSNLNVSPVEENLNTLCYDPLHWKLSQLILEATKEYSFFKNTSYPFKYSFIHIKNRNIDESKGLLLFNLGTCSSFGFNIPHNTSKVSLNIKISDVFPDERQHKVITHINNICDVIKNFINNNKEELNKNNLKMEDFQFLNPIKETTHGNYISLYLDKCSNVMFKNDEKQTNFMNKKCKVTNCVIRLDSVYIGSVIKLRCRLVSCNVEKLDTEQKKYEH